MKYVNYKTIDKLIGKQDNWSELCNNYIEPGKKNTMDTQLNTEERLWNYIDGSCSGEERSVVEKLVESNGEWKEKYHELLQLNKLISNSELEAPSLRFTKNVMEEIAKYQVAPAAKNYIDKKIIWGIGGFFLTMIVGILIYAFAQIRFTHESSGTSELITKYNPGNIEWTKYFNNAYMYIFIMINIVLGLVFFDKYLHRQKNQSKHREA